MTQSQALSMASLVSIDESAAVPANAFQSNNQSAKPVPNNAQLSSDNPGTIRIESYDDDKDDYEEVGRQTTNELVFKRAVTVMLTDEMQWFEDDYIKMEPLGEPGTFGMAFKCHKKGAASRLYAVKQINKAKFYFNETKGVLDNMKNEIQIMNTLSEHENICKLHDTYEDRNYIYLILDFLSGGELYGAIEENEELEESFAQKITTQILSALEYMQEHNVAHLDLKPDNILFVNKINTKNMRAAKIKIIDFGEARILTDKSEKLNQKIGTPYYMAPEIIREIPYEPFPADMWSLGVIIFCMLFGFVPFHAEEENEIFENIKKGFRNEICEGYGAFFPQDIPISEDAMDIISGMLTSDPCARFRVDECLAHQWIKGGKSASKPVPKTRLSIPARAQKRQSMKKLFLVKEEPITIVEDDEDELQLDGDITSFVHIEAPQNGIIKKGYLKKEGKLFKSWKKRWFLLQNNGCVSYYNNHRDLDQPIATFSILGAKIIKSTKLENGIILCTLERNWKLCSFNEKQRNEWCAAFEFAAKPKAKDHTARKQTLHVDTKQFNKLRDSMHETDVITAAQINRDDETTHKIEQEINRKLIAMMNDLDIPENAREKMLNLDQTQKIQLIQQHVISKIQTKQEQNHNHYKGAKSLLTTSNHAMNFHGIQTRPTAASFSLAVQSTQILKRRKTIRNSIFGHAKHDAVIDALINAIKIKMKVMKNDAEIVSLVEKVFETKKKEEKDESHETEAEDDDLFVLQRARTDVVIENISAVIPIATNNNNKIYQCKNDAQVSFCSWIQCIQYMLKNEWDEIHTQQLYKQIISKYISLNHKAKLLSIGVDRRSRSKVFKTIPDCFVGNEAIDWLIKARFVKNSADKRERAKDLGNSFYTKGFIKQVEQKHKFKDEKLWYQFNDALIDKHCLMESNSMKQKKKKSFVE